MDNKKKANFLIDFNQIEGLYNERNESENVIFDRIAKHSDLIENPTDRYRYLKSEKRKYLDRLDLRTLEASGSILSGLNSKQSLFLDRRIQRLIDEIKDEVSPDAKKVIDDFTSQETQYPKYCEPKKEIANFQFENNFNSEDIGKVYQHFKRGLVDKGYCEINDLEKFIKVAFEDEKPLVNKVKLIGEYKREIKNLFHSFYKESQYHKGKCASLYGRLLSENFDGYKLNELITNWSKKG
mgnify:CR=1 FL=1|jgi:hypothetical protein